MVQKEKNAKHTGGYVRLELRADAGAFGVMAGRYNTCLPDATATALLIQGVAVDKNKARCAIFPEWRDSEAPFPSVADADAYLRKYHGRKLTLMSHMIYNPYAMFSVRGGPQLRVFVAELLLGGVDKHFAVYSSDGLWGDNQPHVIPIKIEQGDLEGGNKSAIVAMLGLWGGAYQTGTLISAYELVSFVGA